MREVIRLEDNGTLSILIPYSYEEQQRSAWVTINHGVRNFRLEESTPGNGILRYWQTLPIPGQPNSLEEVEHSFKLSECWAERALIWRECDGTKTIAEDLWCRAGIVFSWDPIDF